MKPILLINTIAIAALFIGSKYYYHVPWYHTVTHATAIMYPTKGNSASGLVTLVEQSDGLHITAHIQGLTPGLHGFHVHEFGNCACDDAKCAGEHYNPTKQPHGGPNSVARHVGDFGNIVADEQGNGTYTAIDT